MSQNLPTASSNYQVIFDNALKAYKTKTGKDLKSDPLLRRLETCNSPDAVITLLQQQIPGFGQSGSTDERLTNWVNPVVNVLYNFAGTIGGAVSLAYPPAGVIFTGISTLLSAVLAINASQNQFIDLFERIENFFIRLGTYVELPPTVEMTDIIVKVMVDVLLIFALVTKEIKQGKIKKFLKALIGRSDMKDALQRFDTLTQEEGRMAIVQSLKATHGVGNDVRGVGDGVKLAIDKVDAVLDGGENIKVELQQVARGVSDLAKDASDEKRNQMRQDIKNWLSPADPFINFNTANEAHHEGTAEWFAQSSVFKSWKVSGSLLWIHGKPGSGKSVLSSTIIRNIKDVCDTGTGHLAFFFFDFKDAGKQDARALLSSIIVQLSDRSVAFFGVLSGFYSAHRDGKQQPSISSLTQCLEDMLKAPEELPVYLIIDAIDECPNTDGMPSSRDQVLTLVERLVALKLPNFHLCVTSRPEADIRISLEPLTSTSNAISLHDENGQEKDIVDFVTSVVRTDKNMRRWREEDKELVISTLSERAAGMFRWVFCQLETLRPCFPSSVQRILAELPESLDATYERILLEIPKTNRVHAHRLLQCLTAAVRPLFVEELAEVLAMDFDGAGGIPKLNEGFRWADQEQAVLSACSSLIAIVEHGYSRRVQFSHFSVKEFLTSDRLATSESNSLLYHHIDLESAHTIMAQVCLSVVFRLDDSMDKETIESYPLGGYVGQYLFNHFEVGDVLSRFDDNVDTLFDPDKPHFKTWFWLREDGRGDHEKFDLTFDPDLDWDEISLSQSSHRSDQSSSGRSFPKYIPRLPHIFCATICQSLPLMRHFISKHSHDLDASDMYGKTALHASAYLSDFEAMRMLIEHNADINARDNKGCTPLHYAVATYKEGSDDDNIRCIRLLLERGADPDAQNNRGSTSLHLAPSYVDLEIVQILVEHVTNINKRNDKGHTPLHSLFLRGHTDIIEFTSIILNHGSDVDAQDNDGSTPLHLAISEATLDASSQYLEEAVGLLLERSANINLGNSQGQTALHNAARRGHTDIMLLILNHGADVDARDDSGSTPLHTAISDARFWLVREAVQLLLEHGASINLRDDQGQTGLHKGCDKALLSDEPDGMEVFRLILNHGADVNAQDNDGSTPLHRIISKVPTKASKDSDAPEGSDASGDSDSSNDSDAFVDPELLYEVVKLLLEHGASGYKENKRGETPFQLATARGLEKITELFSTHTQSERTA